jgi:sugar phosphate isomerase/epimerase
VKVSLFSQSLFALPVDAAIDATAQAGYPAIELACRRPHLDLRAPDQEVERIADRTRKAGLQVAALSLFNDFTAPGTLISQIRAAERGVRLARLFDADVVKLTPGPPASADADENAWSNLQSALDLLAPAARRAGVRLAFETHMRQLTDTLASAERLLGMADGGTVGLAVDFSNLAFAGERMPDVIARLGSRTIHVHVKNGTVGENGAWHFGPLDEGLCDYTEVIPRLRAIGYDGYLSVECLGPDAKSDPVSTASRDLRILEGFIRASDDS